MEGDLLQDLGVVGILDKSVSTNASCSSVGQISAVEEGILPRSALRRLIKPSAHSRKKLWMTGVASGERTVSLV